MVKIDNRKDILLLLLYAPGESGEYNEPISGRTRIVKALFLFREELLGDFKKGLSLEESDFYKYYAWHYGPFSTEVYDDLLFFQLRGFVNIERSKGETLQESIEEWINWKDLTGLDDNDDLSDDYLEYQEEIFCLTDKGEVWVENNLWRQLSRKQKELIIQFKSRVNAMPLRALLRYVYERYPGSIERSTIADKVLA